MSLEKGEDAMEWLWKVELLGVAEGSPESTYSRLRERGDRIGVSSSPASFGDSALPRIQGVCEWGRRRTRRGAWLGALSNTGNDEVLGTGVGDCEV